MPFAEAFPPKSPHHATLNRRSPQDLPHASDASPPRTATSLNFLPCGVKQTKLSCGLDANPTGMRRW